VATFLRIGQCILNARHIVEASYAEESVSGELRHKLFHGGITETSKSSEMVLTAVPIAGLVLIAALRNVPDLPPDRMPELPHLGGAVTDERLEVHQLWRGQPPDPL
jgi:hypothetical protein